MATKKDAPMAQMLEGSATEDAFYALRGRAIQAYANVERALCFLFLHWTGVDAKTGAATFYDLNRHVRDSILNALMRGSHKGTFEAFWESVQGLLKGLAEQRNKIVHWHVSVVATHSGASLELTPVREGNVDPRVPGMKSEDLREFVRKSVFIAEALTRFWNLVGPLGPTADEKKKWLPHFGQALSYPPAADSIFALPPGQPEDLLHRQFLVRPYEMTAEQARLEKEKGTRPSKKNGKE